MRAFATLLPCLSLLAWMLPALGATPQFVAVRIPGPIVMTGRLDDPAWQLAPPAAEAFQAYPHAMAPSPYPMRVRLLYDDEYLYVGIEAGDPEPDLIREHFVRRDRLFSPNSDDVLLLYLDALNTGRSAQMFAVNPRDNQLDGYWSEATQTEDFTSDFNWSAVSARTDTGWSTVMRIPFSSLQHRPGSEQVWKLVVWRNVIRENFYQIASTRIPGNANCLLCYAGDVVLSDFPAAAAGDPLSITPEVTVIHGTNDGDPGAGGGNDGNIGGYLRWRPRSGTVVDGMWNPDFSQLESDKFQPTANNQFALLFPEKRPFFLESSNLFASPVRAIYTRSITRPRWGLRLTEQMAGGSLFTLLASEDRGGGSVIEPGALASVLVPQPDSSIATAGRVQHFASGWRSGGLFTYRRYRDGSYNFVAGPDLLWTPTPADRVRAQYLLGKTRNPDRPDLYAGWNGQSMSDSAAYLDWSHGTEAWRWEAGYQHLGDGFRAWEGYVPQVGIDEVDASLGFNLYPDAGGWLNIVTPQVLYSRADSSDGDLVLRSIAPSLVINGAMSLWAELSWFPDEQRLTAAGPQHLRYATLNFNANPGARFTFIGAQLRFGEDVDFLTGHKGHGSGVTINIQAYPADRLELNLTASYQELAADQPLSGDDRLFDERGAQLRALWHFRSGFYAELSVDSDIVRRNPDNYAIDVNVRDRSSLYTLMLAYEPAPMTHFYIGYRRSTARVLSLTPSEGSRTQLFLKAAYEFAN